MHFESVWMLHVLYVLLLSHTNTQVNKDITITKGNAGGGGGENSERQSGACSRHLELD